MEKNEFYRVFKIKRIFNNSSTQSKRELIGIINDTTYENGLKCDLNFIDTSKITDMSALFESSRFNGDISKWDVSNVRNMNEMFCDSEFNGDISKWNVSNVKKYVLYVP